MFPAIFFINEISAFRGKMIVSDGTADVVDVVYVNIRGGRSANEFR